MSGSSSKRVSSPPTRLRAAAPALMVLPAPAPQKEERERSEEKPVSAPQARMQQTWEKQAQEEPSSGKPQRSGLLDWLNRSAEEQEAAAAGGLSDEWYQQQRPPHW